jgi:hypothetical protein
MMATQEFVVPRSIPMTLAMIYTSSLGDVLDCWPEHGPSLPIPVFKSPDFGSGLKVIFRLISAIGVWAYIGRGATACKHCPARKMGGK